MSDERNGRQRHGIGRRRRRLYMAMAAIVLAVLIAMTVGIVNRQRSRPTTYRTGERHEDITRRLSARLPAAAPMLAFEDVTRASGLSEFRTFAGARSSQLPEDMGSGAAWGDFDNDGDDDLFLVAAGGGLNLPPEELAPSRLYENLGDGTFRVLGAFPDTRIVGMGAAWDDYDGDGAEDIVVTGYNALRLYHNSGEFERDLAIPDLPGFWAGASWADFDRDGDLDLYVCGYVQYQSPDAARTSAALQYGTAVPYTLNPASYKPERNLLYRNDGEDGFREVAELLGVDNPGGRSLSALWRDFDDDGWLDLYVANDISDNVLYRNTGGAFEDISHAAWVADYRGAMGLAAGDWDRDGDEDLYVTHWIAQENALYSSLLSEFASTSGESSPDGASPDIPLRFMDVADAHGLGQIALQRIGWGAAFADFDGDGWLDLAVANGSTFETAELPKKLRPQPDFLFCNDGGNYFHNIGAVGDAFSTPRVTRGLATSDYDNDGDVLFVDHLDGVRLLRNDMQSGHWLAVRLRARVPPSMRPIGAVASAHVDGVVLRRVVGDASYLSQHGATLHYGLGSAQRVDRLVVQRRPGSVDEYASLEADRFWILSEGDPSPVAVERRLAADVDANDTGDERKRVTEFWRLQRAAMRALKVDGDVEAAIPLFRKALVLNPSHEDSIYYFGNCLAARGDVDGALAQFARLRAIDPRSHRAHKRWGTLRAISASNGVELDAAAEALETALEINREATAALTVLGEIALMKGNRALARTRLELVSKTNPRAASALFLLGYIAWSSHDTERTADLLERARAASRYESMPQGAASEGDVERRMHSDRTPLSPFLDESDPTEPAANAFESLDSFLRRADFM